MKNSVKSLLMPALLALILSGCSTCNNSEKDLELKKMELELKEKELALKQKELDLAKQITQDSIQAASSAAAAAANNAQSAAGSAAVSTATHTTLAGFWKDFKSTALKSSYSSLAGFTYFPFLKQSKYIYLDEFSRMSFSAANKKAIAKTQLPSKSLMSFAGGTDSKGNKVKAAFGQGEVFEVKIGGARIFFAKVNGLFKYIGLIYG